MRHGMPEIEINDDLNFSAMAHSDKQIFGNYRLPSFQMSWWTRY